MRTKRERPARKRRGEASTDAPVQVMDRLVPQGTGPTAGRATGVRRSAPAPCRRFPPSDFEFRAEAQQTSDDHRREKERVCVQYIRRHSGARAKASEPGIQMQAPNSRLDFGFTRHSASKTRVNALPRNDNEINSPSPPPASAACIRSR